MTELQVREGPVTCYWCYSEIPYSTGVYNWWCFTCYRYTPNYQVGTYAETAEHCCIREPKFLTYNVSLTCTFEFCLRDAIIVGKEEYQRGLEKKELSRYIHSREYFEKFKEKIKAERDQLFAKKKPPVTMEEIEADPERLKMWEKFNARH